MQRTLFSVERLKGVSIRGRALAVELYDVIESTNDRCWHWPPPPPTTFP